MSSNAHQEFHDC